MAGNLEVKDEKVIKLLLYLDTLRGEHSTGLAAVRNNREEIVIAKAVGPATALFDTKSFDKVMNGFSSRVFIGHNRFATKGEINHANAHPFVFDNVVGAHNGTLRRGHWQIEKEINEDYAVDSMALIHGIGKMGLKTAIGMCEGAWALTWYNSDEKTMNFLRNRERPLHYAFSEDKKKIYWASEIWMLQAIYNAIPDLTYSRDKEGASIFEFEADVHYCFELPVVKNTEVPRFRTRRDIVGAPPFSQAGFSHHGQGSWKNSERFNKQQQQDDWLNDSDPNLNDNLPQELSHEAKRIALQANKQAGRNWPPTKVDKSTTQKVEETGKKGGATKIVELIQGDPDDPYDGAITKEQFDKITRHGCSMCGADVAWGQQGIEVFVKDEIVLCPDHSTATSKLNRFYIPMSQAIG